MRRILFAAAVSFAFGTFALAQSVDMAPPADASQTSSTDQAPAMSHTGHATHDTTGIGTHGNHPKHGKLHGHPNRHACKKHCQEHHDATAVAGDEATKAANVHECKSLCDEHHKKDSPTNPAGNKVAKR